MNIYIRRCNQSCFIIRICHICVNWCGNNAECTHTTRTCVKLFVAWMTNWYLNWYISFLCRIYCQDFACIYLMELLMPTYQPICFNQPRSTCFWLRTNLLTTIPWQPTKLVAANMLYWKIRFLMTMNAVWWVQIADTKVNLGFTEAVMCCTPLSAIIQVFSAVFQLLNLYQILKDISHISLWLCYNLMILPDLMWQWPKSGFYKKFLLKVQLYSVFYFCSLVIFQPLRPKCVRYHDFHCILSNARDPFTYCDWCIVSGDVCIRILCWMLLLWAISINNTNKRWWEYFSHSVHYN